MKFTTETLTATRLSTVLAVIIVLALTPSAAGPDLQHSPQLHWRK